MRQILFLLFYLAVIANSFASDEKPEAVAECAGIIVKKAIPLYPAQALRDKKDGGVVLAVWIDKCGRVQKSEVIESSRNKLLDGAAIEAANKSVFSRDDDSDQELSRIEVPYKFTVDKKEYKAEKVVWPSSHKQAYFVLDESPFPFETVEQARTKVGREPYRLVSLRPIQQMLQLENESGDIWLFLADNRTFKFKLAALYKKIPAEKPTVSVQVLCGPSIIDCTQMKATLLKSGLRPFAKSLNE
ncbi:MAG: energy transducer TonB [Arenimonas sp.]